MAIKYVTQAGAGDNSGDSWETAYAMAAITWAVGNTYYFGGTITGSITVGASPANEGQRITLRGDDATYPCTVSVSSGNSITGTDKHYVTVKGFRVVGIAGVSTIYDNKGKFWIVEDNVVTGGNQCISIRHGNGTIVRNNTCSGATGAAGVGHGIAMLSLTSLVAGGGAITSYQCYGNTCYGNEEDGILVKADSATDIITGAKIYNNICYSNGLNGENSGVLGAGIYVIACTQTTITGNHCYDNVLGEEGYGIGVSDCDETVISGNTCHGNRVDGIEVWGDDAAGHRRANNVKIFANTCYDIPATMYGIDCHNIGSGALICGNLVYDCVYSALIVGSSEGGTGTIANNTFEVEAGSRCVRLEAGCDGWTFKNNLYRGGSALIDEGANALNVVMETNGYDPTVTNQVVDLGGAGGDYTISTIATLDTTAITSDPQLTSDYYLSNTSMEDAGVWVAGVRLHDDLPAPLHPPIGAKCRRDFPGRRFGSGGGTL